MRRVALSLAVAVVLHGCSESAPAEPVVPPPVIEQRATTNAPASPAGYKLVCLSDPLSTASSPTCPVVVWDAKEYWVYSASDNSQNMRVVGYAGTNEVGKLDRPGARYLYTMTVNSADSTVTLVGQANQTIVVGWSELP